MARVKILLKHEMKCMETSQTAEPRNARDFSTQTDTVCYTYAKYTQ